MARSIISRLLTVTVEVVVNAAWFIRPVTGLEVEIAPAIANSEVNSSACRIIAHASRGAFAITANLERLVDTAAVEDIRNPFHAT